MSAFAPARQPTHPISRISNGAPTAEAVGHETRDVYFGSLHGRRTTMVCSRNVRRESNDGPLIIEEPDTTIVVPPGWSAEVDD